MAKIIRNNQIYEKVECVEIEQEKRDYIGYSSIGGKCKRKIWYDYRHTYKHTISLRISRLFNRGKAEEKIIIRDLRRAGMIIFDEDKEVINSKQPKLKGHIDGCVSCVPGFNRDEVMLLEMKTANHSRFEKIKKQGIKEFDTAYWTQINGYMFELGLKKCLYVVTNKNNDERMYQIYELDEVCIKDIQYVVNDILDSKAIPPQIGNPIWYECKFCDAYEICHGSDEIVKNCRNCEYAIDIGTGLCSIGCNTRNDKDSTYDGIKCSSYKKLELLE